MIFRMLAETHSDAEIVAFYDDVLGGTPLDRALSSSFGLTVDQLTADWRRLPGEERLDGVVKVAQHGIALDLERRRQIAVRLGPVLRDDHELADRLGLRHL